MTQNNSGYTEECINLYNVEEVKVFEVDDKSTNSKLFDMLQHRSPIVYNERNIRSIIQRRFDLLLSSLYPVCIFGLILGLLGYSKIAYKSNCISFIIIVSIILALSITYSCLLIFVPIIPKGKKDK